MRSDRLQAGQILSFLETMTEYLEMGCSPYAAVLKACEVLGVGDTQPFFSFLYHQVKQFSSSGLSDAEVFRRMRQLVPHPTLRTLFELLEHEAMWGAHLQHTLREVIRRTIVDQYDQIEHQIEKYSMQLLPLLFGCGFLSTGLLLAAAVMVVLGGP